MKRDEALRLLRRVTDDWVDDPDSAVVWAGSHDGRQGLRMSQETRDFTTIWFDIGELTVRFEAYLLPGRSGDVAEVYRRCLVRNWTSWPATIALDRDGDLYVIGRVPLEQFDEAALDRAVGSVYEVVDLTFRTLVEVMRRSRKPD